MAASATAMMLVSPLVLAPAKDACKLSSGSAFRSTTTTSLVQQIAPISSQKANRVVAARAHLSEEKSGRREVLGSILAGAAALGFSGEAFAFGSNPLPGVKNKADELVKGAQNNAPELPNAGGALENAQSAAGDAVNDFKGRIDGIWGKNKSGPMKSGKSVASSNGGGAIGDAQKRLSEFGKNPIAGNIEKATTDAQNNIGKATGENSGSARAGREFFGKDSGRVDEATKNVENLGSDLQRKASDAFEDAKNFVGQAQSQTPSLPDAPSIPTPDTNNFFSGLKNLKGEAESKLEEAKKAAGNAVGQ